MKTITIIIFTILFANAYSQITVDQNDMQATGDTIFYGVSNVQGFDPLLTGTNYNWDFTNLNTISNRADTILSVFQTPVAYNVVFNPLIANQAYINQTPPSFGNGITVTDYYDFYKKSSTYYRKAGFGAVINGVPTPVKYDNPEIYYTFPLNYLNSDSSTSSFGMSIPSYGYFGQTINHKFLVDGWGTLAIRYGTFQVLRVKATIDISDTIYYDNLMYGIRFNRPTSYEYYWIAKNLQGHALKISQAGMGYSAEYLDSLSYFGVSEQKLNDDFLIYPNPVIDVITIYNNNFTSNTQIKIFDNFGRVVYSNKLNNKLNQINLLALKQGIYHINIVNNNTLFVKTFCKIE